MLSWGPNRIGKCSLLPSCAGLIANGCRLSMCASVVERHTMIHACYRDANGYRVRDGHNVVCQFHFAPIPKTIVGNDMNNLQWQACISTSSEHFYHFAIVSLRKQRQRDRRNWSTVPAHRGQDGWKAHARTRATNGTTFNSSTFSTLFDKHARDADLIILHIIIKLCDIRVLYSRSCEALVHKRSTTTTIPTKAPRDTLCRAQSHSHKRVVLSIPILARIAPSDTHLSKFMRFLPSHDCFKWHSLCVRACSFSLLPLKKILIDRSDTTIYVGQKW